MPTADDTRAKFDRFLELARREVPSRPWLVVILMHEYFRHLYPADANIPFDTPEPPLSRISRIPDNRYVPIETHTTRKDLEACLQMTGFTAITKIASGRSTDLDCPALKRVPDAEAVRGEGEHRYLLTKGERLCR